MADDKFTAKFEVKPTAIPDRIVRDLENVKHPSAIKLIPVAKNNETGPEGTQKTSGLSYTELSEFIEDPFWVKTRKTLLCFSILLFFTLFALSILIIVYTPPCEPVYVNGTKLTINSVGSPCKVDSECIEGSECKSMNITVTSFKTCQCREGFMSRDGYCSSAFPISAPSLITVLAAALIVLFANKSNLRF